MNTLGNKIAAIVSSFARQGLQSRVFTDASNVPGGKVIMRNSHMPLSFEINRAGAGSEGEE